MNVRSYVSHLLMMMEYINQKIQFNLCIRSGMISYINISTHKKVVYVTSKLIIICIQVCSKKWKSTVFLTSWKWWNVESATETSKSSGTLNWVWLTKQILCLHVSIFSQISLHVPIFSQLRYWASARCISNESNSQCKYI